jgi:hypothetical protein
MKGHTALHLKQWGPHVKKRRDEWPSSKKKKKKKERKKERREEEGFMAFLKSTKI